MVSFLKGSGILKELESRNIKVHPRAVIDLGHKAQAEWIAGTNVSSFVDTLLNVYPQYFQVPDPQTAVEPPAAPVGRSLRQDLAGVLNSYSQENGSNTPDFILAGFLLSCLGAFDGATNARSRWYQGDVDRDKVPQPPAHTPFWEKYTIFAGKETLRDGGSRVWTFANPKDAGDTCVIIAFYGMNGQWLKGTALQAPSIQGDWLEINSEGRKGVRKLFINHNLFMEDINLD